MTFEELRTANKTRCESAFHPIDHWSVTDWGCAMAGECGEACNIAKKIRRLEGTYFTRESERDSTELTDKLMDELADMIIYADLFAARVGRDLGEAVRQKFNETSKLVGSDIKL